MSEATQGDGKTILGILVQELSDQLAGIFPGLDCAVVFWNRGEHDNRLRNVVYATPKAFPEALEAMETAIRATREAASGLTLHGLDTPERVCFYEQEFYVLSNFSAFEVLWSDSYSFKTAEHCYHWLRFATGAANGRLGGARPTDDAMNIADAVRRATSAYDAFKIAQENKHLQRADWNDVKVEKMRMVIRAKAMQHEYVHRKLLQTGDRELVENSWRDAFWGWGPNRNGQNMLGKLWMEIRAELRRENVA